MSRGALSPRVIVGAVLVSALSLAGSFYVADEVAAAFCLGAFFAFLCVTILGLSFRMHVPEVDSHRSRDSTSKRLPLGGIGQAGRAVRLEVELHRDTGSRLSGVLTATCRGSPRLRLSRLEIVQPSGCRLAVERSEPGTVDAAVPVSVDFADESGALDVEVSPDRPCVTRFFVLLPEAERAPRHLRLSVQVEPDGGSPFAQRIRAAIPGWQSVGLGNV